MKKLGIWRWSKQGPCSGRALQDSREVIGFDIIITVCCLDDHRVDADPLLWVGGAVILLNQARLELLRPNDPPQIRSERAIVGHRDPRIGVVMLSPICIERCSGIPTSSVRI